MKEIHKQPQKSRSQKEINCPIHTNLDQAPICCVKMLQLFTYEQEMKNLMEQQDVAASTSLKTLLPFIDKEGLPRVGGGLQQSTLPYQTMHQMISSAKHHFTKFVLSAEDKEFTMLVHNF